MWLISIDMGLFYSIKYNMQDVFCKVRAYKWKLIFCVAVSLIGFGLGIALFYASKYGWWYYNRCSFASKLIDAGFSVFLWCVASCAIVYLLLVLCNMLRATHYLAYLVNLLACFYCGATTAAVFVYSVMWGILYVLFVTIEWLIIMCFACFVCVCEKPYCRRFCESVRDLKQTAFVLAIGLIYKIVALFIILKLLTMLI